MKKISYKLLSALPATFFLAGTAYAAGAAKTAHHGDAHGTESAAGLPQMDPTWFASQLFWLAVVFIFLYMVFAKSVLPSLSSTIEGRRDLIESDLESARRLKDEAEKIHGEYEAVIMAAKDKATLSYADTEAKIKEENETRLAELSQTSAETIKKADTQLQKAKDKALADVDDITTEMVILAVEKLAGVKVDSKTAKATIDGLTEKTTVKKAA